MSVDYSLFFYVMIILPIILSLSMLLVTSIINNKRLKREVICFKDKINKRLFKELIIEDYNSFEKYELWHFTEHMKASF